MFFVGLDLGQSQDFTAIAVIERRAGILACVHLQRCPLGTSYPRVVDHVRGLLATPALRSAALVVDATGVGAPVVDLLRLSGLRPVPVIITGGDAVGEDETRWRVPKRDLAATLQVLLQTRRLKVAEALPDAKVLAAEMENFQVKVTAASNETFGAWREGQHDDLVLAVALACWWAERNPPRMGPVVVGDDDDDDEPRREWRNPFHEAIARSRV